VQGLTGGLALALLGVALVDSLNPSALAITAALLSRPSPYRRAAAYIAGIVVAYGAVGVAVLLGAGDLLTSLVEVLRRPAVLFSLEAVLGLGLVLFALRRRRREKPSATAPLGLGAAFLAGVTVSAVESTTALPYLGALALVLRADLSLVVELLVLAVYVGVFVLPPVLLVLAHRASPAAADRALTAVRRALARLDGPVLRAVTALLGAGLLVDGAVQLVRL
jgi:cytochrome c biogenesis protein CcdA